jgi:UDP-glucose 4-epimerase
MKVAVTGGAGFIGSHLVDRLLSMGREVVVIDDLSTGRKEQVASGAELVVMDVRHDISAGLEGCRTVFHMAGDPDVRESAIEPGRGFDINVRGTFSVLESCRKAGVESVALASTSTVYGEPEAMPTPEAQPCRPISNYGASKLACEGYLSSYSASYGMKGTALRFANIFGERSVHGVMHDFFVKLRNDPARLEILGDGKQEKSYLHVSDCVSAVLAAEGRAGGGYDVFNVGSGETISVESIAGRMCRLMKLGPELMFTGTPRGWVGDIRAMLLDTSKLRGLGWKQETDFDTGLSRYIAHLSST